MDEIERLHQIQMIALQRARAATTEKGRDAYLTEARQCAKAVRAVRGQLGDARRGGRRFADGPLAPPADGPVPLAPEGPGGEERPGRLRFARPLECACGERGEAIFEEDDLDRRPTGGANTQLVWIKGAFRRDARGRFCCLECDARVSAA